MLASEAPPLDAARAIHEEQRAVDRAIGALLVMTGLTMIIVAIFLVLVPLLETQIAQLVQRLPNYLNFVRQELDQLLRLAPEPTGARRLPAPAGRRWMRKSAN